MLRFGARTPRWPPALLLVLAAAAPAAPTRQVEFKTADGWTLSALERPARRGGLTLVLAHGVGSSKAEWSLLAERLAAKGIGSLAVDLRGHGGSTEGPGGERNFQDFDATGEWGRAVEDLRAAARWLEARGVKPSRIAFGGASIGANLASQAAFVRTATPCLLLLSPGPDYRGTRLAARPGLKTLAAAAPTDPYAFQTLEPLSRMAAAATLEASSGHGAQMLGDARTLDAVVEWAARCASSR